MPDVAILSVVTEFSSDDPSDGHSFHKLSRVIAETHRLVTLPPETTVDAALAKMSAREISQVPVVVGQRVLGLFSYQSFAQGLGRKKDVDRKTFTGLPIEEFLDDSPAYAHVTDDVRTVLPRFQTRNAILIGDKTRITAIVTRYDVAQYLHRISEPFMLLQEIEQNTRVLMLRAAPVSGISEPIRVRLGETYETRGQQVPTTLEELTIQELKDVLTDGRNWPSFSSYFGGSRDRAADKFLLIPRIRNQVLHFRGDCSEEDRGVLLMCRDWLVRRVLVAQTRSGFDGP